MYPRLSISERQEKLEDDPDTGKKNCFQPSYLALNEIRHYQKRVNLLIHKLPFQHLVWQMHRPSTSRSISNQQPSQLSKKPVKHILSDSLKIPTYVQSMPRGSPSCQKTSSWHAAFVERPKQPPSSFLTTSWPFSGPTNSSKRNE